MSRQPPRVPVEPRRAPLLPAELPWLYMVMPLPAAYLTGHDLLEKPLAGMLSEVGKMYLPFIVFGATYHVIYGRFMPRALDALRRAWQRVALHLGVLLVVTIVVGGAVAWLLERAVGHAIDRVDFLIVSLIFSSAVLYPALAVQKQRARAQTAEHLALVERKAALEAQLQALQARTDPHFLFNSLNTVASLIPEDPVLAERSLERLADLFRYALESSRLRTVRLERELAMIGDYLELQSARFGARLQTHLEFDRALAGIEVPPLLLQPLVENAILHGTAQRRGGRVEISVRREQDSLVVEVCDDGPGPGASRHTGAGTAIAGVIERLQLHYAERATLLLQPGPRGGCLARLALPLGERA